MLSKRNLFIYFFLINSLIFLIAYQSYPGSYLIYFLFSVVFFALISLNWLNNFSYSYFFLSIFLWLGFYLKTVSHLLFSFPYLDPIGGFVSSSASWDEVLLLATISALGVMVSRILLTHQIKKISTESKIDFCIPIVYSRFGTYLKTLLVLTILFLSITNSYFGIHQIGLAPRTIFVYPINAFIAYMLNFGLISIVAIYLWWDIQASNKFYFTLAILLLEALCISMSIVSRGIFIFHFLPIFLVLYRMHLFRLNLKSLSALFFSATIFFATSYFVVDAARGYLYRAQDVDFRVESKKLSNELNERLREREDLEALATVSVDKSLILRRSELDREILLLKTEVSKNQSDIKSSSASLAGKLTLIISELRDQWVAALSRAGILLTNRWVGLEGAMSVQALPNKGFDLFFVGLRETYQPDVVPLYQHLSKSIYTGMDPNQWKFGSLPGCTAFLYYSGSFSFVFLGMLLLASLAIAFEYLILLLTGNLFLVSLYSCFIANMIAQLGDVPRQGFKTIIMLVMTAVIFRLSQRLLVHKHL